MPRSPAILLASGVPTAVLRAAVIIGSGSASFEMLRYLTERLPVMVTPSWVRTRIQPIAVRDVLRYLVGCARLPDDVSRTFDIGGPDILTYRDMMQRYARVAGLPERLILAVPMLTPRLSSLWIGLVTPVPPGLARPLAESLRYEVVCHEHDIARYVPDPDPPGHPIAFDDALELALRRVRDAEVTTRWSNAAVPGAPSDPLPTDPDWAGGSSTPTGGSGPWTRRPRCCGGWSKASAATTAGTPSRSPGRCAAGWTGWSAGWGCAAADGTRAGFRVGDSLDFWRVEEVVPGRLLRLRAEMRLPGLAWLELTVGHDAEGRTLYGQRALFHPHGLTGHAYWWSISPFHAAVFGGMARNIAAAAAAEHHARPA